MNVHDNLLEGEEEVEGDEGECDGEGKINNHLIPLWKYEIRLDGGNEGETIFTCPHCRLDKYYTSSMMDKNRKQLYLTPFDLILPLISLILLGFCYPLYCMIFFQL